MKTVTADRKLFFLRIAAVVLSGAVLCFAVYLFWDKSGAWLRDEGDWVKREYVLGKIDYVLSINETVLDTKDEIEYDAAIPVAGGVKINDTADREPYAEENFNEGVTAAHFKIENTSDIRVNMTVELECTGFADGENGQNLFYMILPEGAVVNREKYTVAIGENEPVSYKTYIKSCLSDLATFEGMKNSLSSYYAANAGLYERSKAFSPAGGDETLLEFDVLFWSEYDTGELNGASSDRSASDWKNSNGTVESMSASFKLIFALSQPDKK